MVEAVVPVGGDAQEQFAFVVATSCHSSVAFGAVALAHE